MKSSMTHNNWKQWFYLYIFGVVLSILFGAMITPAYAIVGFNQITIAAHGTQISNIDNSNVMGLEPYLTVDTVSDSRGTLVRLESVNLQLVNGTGTTNGTPNGLGNLIVGYDAARNSGSEVCSLGQYTNQSDCEANGETWALNHKSGSYNIVGGDRNSYSSFGGLVVGQYNVSNRDFASVSGGVVNTASGISSSISGGQANSTSGSYSSVSGGRYNYSSGGNSSISGGYSRSAGGTYDWAAGTLWEDQ